MADNIEIMQANDVIAFDQLQKNDAEELIEEITNTLEISYLSEVDEFIHSLLVQIDITDEARAILKDGIFCRVMTTRKLGWTTGKLKLSLQFIPDENKDFEIAIPFGNSLDDIRKSSI